MAYAFDTMAPDVLEGVRERVRGKLRMDGGKVVPWGRANAAKGIVPS